MALQVYIRHYGTRDIKTTPVNNAIYAKKIAEGLRRIADGLDDAETVFLDREDFSEGAADTTRVHFFMVTDSTEIAVPPDDVGNPATIDITPQAQFNVHMLMKHITDEEEFAQLTIERLKDG